ncbi:hypothetical protein AAJV73_09225 [Cyanobium sp. BSA11S]|uniref:hypothetical protein n=1 Tax=Cyanobium sp. BSA11S TaxID=3108224 RepID=UPI003D81A086
MEPAQNTGEHHNPGSCSRAASCGGGHTRQSRHHRGDLTHPKPQDQEADDQCRQTPQGHREGLGAS